MPMNGTLLTIAERAEAYLKAQRALRAHPDNDSTKRFDAKLFAVEQTEDALAAALTAAGYQLEEPE